MTSRFAVVETVNEDDEYESLTSYDIGDEKLEREMRLFQNDLDQLTKSIDEDTALRNLLQRAKHASETVSQTMLGSDHSSSNSSRPPVSSILRPSKFSTPPPTTGPRAGTVRTPSEPLPVDTPAQYLFQSPDPGSLNDRMEKLFFSSNEKRYLRDNRVDLEDEVKSPAGSDTSVETWKSLVEVLREAMARQDLRMRSLEEENRRLREELLHAHEIAGSGRRRPADHSTYTPPRPPPRPSMHSTRSPGAQFVSELSQLMDLDPRYQGQLARIMDQHFDRQNSGR